MTNVDFDPQIFIEATNCLARTPEEMQGPNRILRWGCFAILTISCFDFDTEELNRAQNWYYENFVKQELFGALFLDAETGSISHELPIEEQQDIRFMLLYLAYLVACDELGLTVEEDIAA